MRIEVEVFKEVDGVDMVIRFFEVELLCGKRHRGLHGSHNRPLFIGLLVANIAASVCFAKCRAKNFIYNGLSQRHPACASLLSMCSCTAAEQYSRHSFSFENERLPCFVS